MATLHSITSGNFSSSTTWGVVDPTSFLDSRASVAGSVTTTTTNASQPFTPGAITIIGVSMQIVGRITSPTGTVTMRLWNNTAGTIVKDVTINASDLPTTGGANTPYIGWTYFKFDVSVTLLSGTAYTIRMFSSVSNETSVYTDGTANNYSRALITSTTQAPASTDVLIISGQHTAPATFTAYTVTMNITSNAVSYGQSYIGSRGSLSYGVAASTNYALKLAGSLYVGRGGTLNIGTLASPIPSNSSATLEILCTTALQYSIFVYGAMTTQSIAKIVASKLDSNVAISATSSTSSTVTGWKSGDIIVVPSTTRTYTEFETITLNADAAGTSLSHSAYVNAHGGNATTRVQADIVNSTRNITILSTSTTFKTNIQMFALSVTSFYHTKFQDLGSSVTITTAGICVNPLSTGTFDFQYNVVTTTVVQSLANTANTALIATTNTTISNNLFYKLGWSVTTVTTVSATIINDNNYFIGCLSSSQVIFSNLVGSNNVLASNGVGAYAANIKDFVNNSTNNSFYSNSGAGFYYANPITSNITSGLKVWRNNNSGIFLTNIVSISRSNVVTITDSYIFGNLGAGISNNNRVSGKFYFSNCYIYGGSTLVQQYGVSMLQIYVVDTIYFDNCYFGYSDSSLTSSLLSTSTLLSPLSGATVIFSNCKFNSQADVTYSQAGYPMTNIENSSTALKYNGVTGSNRTWYSNGFLSTDSTIYNNSAPSLRMTPNNATLYKLTQPTTKIPVKAGQTCTVSVKVRESIALDGTVYNGTPPRLVYAFNPILGNLVETVGSIYPDYNLITQPETLTSMLLQRTTLGTLGTSPSGLDNAYPVIVNNTISFAYTGAAGTNIVTTSYTVFSGARNFSVYVKAAGLNIARVMLGSATTMSATQYVDVNLNTGAIIGSAGGTNAAVETLSAGWYRVSLDVTSVSPTNNRFGVGFSDTVKTTGNGVDGVYVWGLQLTDGSGVKPYIAGASWQTLTYTTPAVANDGVAEFYVDCDGTTGWINVDDWSTTTSNDSRGTDFWNPSGTYIESDWRRPGGSKTFTS